MKAFLILEDGTVFEGTHIGADKEIISEIVFNTSMAGYLEVLTDPSYAGQAVCMTYPLIGNYGICRDDCESERPWPDGFIVRELSRIPSNFRCDCTIQEYLEENGVPGIAGIDTRALTKILREKGTMNGMITTNEAYDLNEVLPKLKAYTTGKVVEKVTCKEKYVVNPTTDLAQNGPLSGAARFDKEAYEKGVREPKPALVTELSGQGLKVALLDLGAKRNIARSLAERGCEVTVYPAGTPAQEIIDDNPDGIMLSNGPGDPKECTGVIAEIKKVIRYRDSYFRNLSGTSADGSGYRRGYPQNEIWTQRRQPSGKGSDDRKSIYFFSEPWICGRYRQAGSFRSGSRIYQCQRRYQRGSVLHRQEHFHRTVPPGSMSGTPGLRLPV